MNNLTIEQAIEHLHEMADRLEEMQKKYPDAVYTGVRLCLNWGKLEDARRDGDGVFYTSIGRKYWKELGIDIHFTTKDEEDED